MLIYVQILKERGDLEVANKKKESVKKKSTKAISKLNEKNSSLLSKKSPVKYFFSNSQPIIE